MAPRGSAPTPYALSLTCRPKKAVLLCAGEGTRLRPLTYEIPKPLVRVGGKPLLGWNLEVLAAAGVEEVLINLHHKPERIIAYVGDGARFGVSIQYSFEEELLGTAGALDRMRDRLTGPFLVVYGDVVLDDFPFESFFAFHRDHPGIGTVVLQETDRPGDCDIAELDPGGRIVAWHPAPGDFRYGKWGNAAVYLLEPRILSYLPRGARWDFVRDLFPAVLAAGETLWGFISPVELLDIGTPERLEEARRRFGG
ncbi:MAG: nucleotidyltransferase family protein [Caldiserica bacterium]|nr:nucleotidyltransferase family protein [Caldisericota bacterium]